MSEGISQSLSQSASSQLVENPIEYFKLHSNLLKAFWADVKACFGLVLPIQYYLIVGWFLGDVFCGPRGILYGPYYTVLLSCMMYNKNMRLISIVP